MNRNPTLCRSLSPIAIKCEIGKHKIITCLLCRLPPRTQELLLEVMHRLLFGRNPAESHLGSVGCTGIGCTVVRNAIIILIHYMQVVRNHNNLSRGSKADLHCLLVGLYGTCQLFLPRPIVATASEVKEGEQNQHRVSRQTSKIEPFRYTDYIVLHLHSMQI